MSDSIISQNGKLEINLLNLVVSLISFCIIALIFILLVQSAINSYSGGETYFTAAIDSKNYSVQVVDNIYNNFPKFMTLFYLLTSGLVGVALSKIGNFVIDCVWFYIKKIF